MIRTVRYLVVQFDTAIRPWELSAFRGAIARKAGWEHELFHNHDNASGGFHYRIPLIQYKQERGRALMLCLNEGIEELQHFFGRPDWTLELNGRTAPIRIAHLQVKQYSLTVTQPPRRYHIRHWIALSQDNYRVYQALGNLVERLYFLQQILRNQIVALYDQLHALPEERIEVHIQNLKDERWVSYKGVKVLAFSIEFLSNAILPDYLGIGKGASVGWGVVKALKKPAKMKREQPKQTDSQYPVVHSTENQTDLNL